MNRTDVLQIAVIYQKFFESNNIQKKEHSYNILAGLKEQILAHCYMMLDRLEGFVLQGNLYKAFRFLGFIEGCLWTTACYTLQELKDHNRSDPLTHEDLEDWEYGSGRE